MPDDARYTNAPEMCLDKGKPPNFARKLRQLFAAMSISGSTFGVHDIHYFNGGLFADDEVFQSSAGRHLAHPDRANSNRRWI